MSMQHHTHHLLDFPQFGRQIRSRPGETIFQSARRSGLRIVGACGGRGSCGTCILRVVEGQFSHGAGGHDPVLHQAKGTGKGKWLRACQILPQSDCVLEVAQRSLAPVVRAEPDHVHGQAALDIDPDILWHEVAVEPATLDDPVSDAERVTRALASPVDEIDVIAARALPDLLRSHGWKLRVGLRRGEWIGSFPPGKPALGLAVDLGTTNAAAFLMDLETGAQLGRLGIENPQTAWGADLISRINHAAREPAAAAALHEAATAAINSLAHDLCHAIGAAVTDIADIVVCGNTAMHHLLLGLPVRQLGRAPFVAAMAGGIELKARELGITVAPGAYLHAAPNIGGFVGGDHVAALLATEPDWRDKGTSLVLDIGTNTEISLIHQGVIRSASCPSGPALEGGHISCGMRAAIGAIERVKTIDGRIHVETIGGSPAVGLCGSGVVDAVAALLQGGMLGGRGRLTSGHPDIHDAAGGRYAVLAPDIHFSQHDIRAVQLAKAAIQTATDLLLSDAGLAAQDLDRVIIAGAFGVYLDVASGIAIGLFPKLPLERFRQVGNAAGLGVRQMLLSRKARSRAMELAGHCRYVELSSRGEFQKIFLNNIGFPPISAERRAS